MSWRKYTFVLKREDVSTNMTWHPFTGYLCNQHHEDLCGGVQLFAHLCGPGGCQHLGECASRWPALIPCQRMHTSKHSTAGVWTPLLNKEKSCPVSKVLCCAPQTHIAIQTTQVKAQYKTIPSNRHYVFCAMRETLFHTFPPYFSNIHFTDGYLGIKRGENIDINICTAVWVKLTL